MSLSKSRIIDLADTREEVGDEIREADTLPYECDELGSELGRRRVDGTEVNEILDRFPRVDCRRCRMAEEVGRASAKRVDSL